MQTNSQQQAEAIYDLITAIKGSEKQERYGALCHRFPLIVRENGLAAAFGFLAAKGDGSPENLLLAHYAAALGFGSTDALRQSSISANLGEYQRMTRTALQAAEWFKRYAEAILKVDSTGASEKDQGE